MRNPNWKGGKPKWGPFPPHQLTIRKFKAHQLMLQCSSSGTQAEPAIMETRTCYICNIKGPMSPHKRKSKIHTKSTGSSPTVLFVAGPEGKNTNNLHPVTVGDQINVGLRETRAKEIVHFKVMLPGKTLAVIGVGGINPAVPMALAFLDWKAGKGLKDMKVMKMDTICSSILLETDLYRKVSQYVTTCYVRP